MTDSAFLFTLNPDGSAIIGYEDYDIDIFDGDDYEVTYLLDAENFNNLLHHFNIQLNHDTKKQLKKNLEIILALLNSKSFVRKMILLMNGILGLGN